MFHSVQQRALQRGALQDKPPGISVTHQLTQLAAITWVNITLLHFSRAGQRVGCHCLPSPSLASLDQQLPHSLLSCSSPLNHASPDSSPSHFPLLSFLPFPFSFCASSCSPACFFLFTSSSTYVSLHPSPPEGLPNFS